MTGSFWLKASIAAVVSFRKQRLIFAASSCDSGGERRVFENPARGALIIMPIAHLSVTSGFRRPEVSISSFIVCIHGECISVFLRRSAQCFSESACERSLIPGSSLVRKKRVHDGGSLCRLPGFYRSSDSPFIAAGVILVIEIEMVVGQELHNFCYR